MLGQVFDAVVYHGLRKQRAAAALPSDTRWLDIPSGDRLCLRDSGGDLPPLIIATASPCGIAHYDAIYQRLRDRYRVIVFDMPGFGFSPPRMAYRHDLQDGASAIRDLIETLELQQVTLVCSSINGLYALAASRQLGTRLARLVLLQTPDHGNMLAWFARTTQTSIRTPMVGQYLNFVSRRRFPPAWFRVTLADPCTAHPLQRDGIARPRTGRLLLLRQLRTGDAQDPGRGRPAACTAPSAGDGHLGRSRSDPSPYRPGLGPPTLSAGGSGDL